MRRRLPAPTEMRPLRATRRVRPTHAPTPTPLAALFGALAVALAAGAAHALDGEPVAGPFEHLPVPGGIAVVDLGPADGDAPRASWRDRPVAVLEDGGRWHAVVGIGLGTEAGSQTLAIERADGTADEARFEVEPKAYAEQRLIIENKRKVNPAPVDMARIERENARLKVVKSTRADRLLAERFEWPLTGPVSSPFGLRRFYNDQPRRPHGGIDIAAPEGTEIRAPADGLVIETGDYFFNGNSVFVEHGLGLQTFYAHMSRIDVEPGQRVARGEVLGAVGATGRVTGPHLHWSAGLNGTWIDPRLLLDGDGPPPAPED